MRTLHVLER